MARKPAVAAAPAAVAASAPPVQPQGDQMHVVNVALVPVSYMYASGTYTVPPHEDEPYVPMSSATYYLAVRHMRPLEGDPSGLPALRIIDRRPGESWEAASNRVYLAARALIDAGPAPEPEPTTQVDPDGIVMQDETESAAADDEGTKE